MTSTPKSLFRVRNLIALAIIVSALISIPHVITTSQEWAVEDTETSLLSVGTGFGESSPEGSIEFRKIWILSWFGICALVLLSTPLVARARGREFGIWFLLTGIWMLLPTPFASNVHKFWWGTFQAIISTQAPRINLLGGVASCLIIGLPFWALILFSVKTRPQGETSQG